MLKAIIFDFDGLILDTEYPEYASWLEIYQAFNLDLPLHQWAGLIGRGASTIAKTPYDDLEEQLGRSIDRAVIRAERRRRFAELLENESLLPGVQSLLDDAKACGVRLGVASSSPREWVTGSLDQLGISSYFEAIRCGDEVSYAKPEPDVYLAALDALQLSADEAVALEDSANGVAAAKAAGCFCIAVPNSLTRHTSLAHADVVLESLEGLTVLDIEQMAGSLP